MASNFEQNLEYDTNRRCFHGLQSSLMTKLISSPTTACWPSGQLGLLSGAPEYQPVVPLSRMLMRQNMRLVLRRRSVTEVNVQCSNIRKWDLNPETPSPPSWNSSFSEKLLCLQKRVR